MAGTHVVSSREKIEYGKATSSRRASVITTAWTSDASDASVPDLSLQLNGYIVKAVMNPVSTAEVTSVIAVADVAGSLNNKYFTIKSALNATSYYVWMNVNAAGVDPAPGGTGLQVTLATNATAASVATAIKTALDAAAGTPFVTTRNTATLTITNSAVGIATDAADTGTTGFTITVTTQGRNPADNYDIVINDDDGADIMGSDLINRDYTNTEQVYPSATSSALRPPLAVGNNTIVISNVSNVSSSGTITLYVVERI